MEILGIIIGAFLVIPVIIGSMFYFGAQSFFAFASLIQLIGWPHKKESWRLFFDLGFWAGILVYGYMYLMYIGGMSGVECILFIVLSWPVSMAVGNLLDKEPFELDVRDIGRKRKIRTR